MFYYKRDARVERLLAETSRLDPEDVEHARILLSNPDLLSVWAERHQPGNGAPVSYIRISVKNAIGRWDGVIEPEVPCSAKLLEQTANEVILDMTKRRFSQSTTPP